ncbi:MAG: molybdenum cofactor carrier [Nitrospirae bacterium]|nr:MAG: molybdenum cofactor carrier [Nitrospirota bacterium]
MQRIVSGGQTGVDRAALDVARELGVPSGGWCPKGRTAEDGVLAACYKMKETPTADYPLRTEWNVRDSDATLVLTRGEPTEGTAFTIELARRLRKPSVVVDLAQQTNISPLLDWISAHNIQTLNIAGPRESKCPGIYAEASKFLRHVLSSGQ